MKRKIILHGDLAKKFAGPYELDIETAQQAGRALCVLLPGFREHVSDKSYRVVRGHEENGFHLSNDSMSMTLGKANELHIIPEISGAGGARGRSVGKIVLGVALIGFALPGAALAGGALGVFSGSQVAGVGLALAVSGTAALLSKPPESQLAGPEGTLEAPNDSTSFLFSGPQNITEQGAVVPLVYGQMRTGSVVVAASITTEDIAV